MTVFKSTWMRAALGALALSLFAVPQAQAIDTVPLPEKPRAQQVRRAPMRAKKRRAPAAKRRQAARRAPARARAPRRK